MGHIMKANAVVQLQVSDVLGMIGSHVGMKYNQKIAKVNPIYKEKVVGVDKWDNEITEKVLSHFEVHFEQELSNKYD